MISVDTYLYVGIYIKDAVGDVIFEVSEVDAFSESLIIQGEESACDATPVFHVGAFDGLAKILADSVAAERSVHQSTAHRRQVDVKRRFRKVNLYGIFVYGDRDIIKDSEDSVDDFLLEIS